MVLPLVEMAEGGRWCTACQTGHFYICPAAPFAAARARARETGRASLLVLLVISAKRT